MTAIVPWLVMIWAVGTIIAAIYWSREWVYYQNRRVFRAENTRAARHLLFCWAWPLFGLCVLRQIIRDALGRDGRR